MIATLKGRLQTKLLTFIILAVTTALFIVTYSPVFIIIGLITAAVGLIIETALGVTLDWQPGWINFMVAAIEFLSIVNIAILIGFPVPLPIALAHYLLTWGITQLFLIYILPVFKLNWNDNGNELW